MLRIFSKSGYNKNAHNQILDDDKGAHNQISDKIWSNDISAYNQMREVML